MENKWVALVYGFGTRRYSILNYMNLFHIVTVLVHIHIIISLFTFYSITFSYFTLNIALIHALLVLISLPIPSLLTPLYIYIELTID